jgi:hypothetical protein
MPPRGLFADTFYWIALLFPRDAYHAAVVSFSRSLGTVRLVTTDEVLAEFLNLLRQPRSVLARQRGDPCP